MMNLVRSRPSVARTLLLCAALMGFGHGPDAGAADRDAVTSLKAYAAYKAGDYAQAYDIWLPLAEAGNTTAIINIANMYEQGQGREVDLAKSVEWLRRGAELGDTRAQLYLGLAYEKGRGAERDNRQAARWFRAAAEQGDKDAQFNLGVMLATAYGAGPEKATAEQTAEARRWLEAAAAGGHSDARAFLELFE